MPGPDHKASLEPEELKAMVEAVRSTELALGTVITEDMMCIKRPGTGVAPEHLSTIIGMTIQQDKTDDEVINWEDFKTV